MARKKKEGIEKVLVRDKRAKPLQNARGADVIAHDALANKAMELRLQHKTYETIAREMGLNGRDHAFKLVNHAYTTMLAGMSQKAAQIREEQNSAYDALIERWMPLALSEELDVSGTKEKANGELQHIELEAWAASAKAAEMVMKALDQKAKINGLQTIKVEHKGDSNYDHLYKMAHTLVEALKEKRANAIEV